MTRAGDTLLAESGRPAASRLTAGAQAHFDARKLAANLHECGHEPRLIWYYPNGRRITLSGQTLCASAAQIGGLLSSYYFPRAGDYALLDLTTHWRCLPWLLGIWASGMRARFWAPDQPLPDGALLALITDQPSARAELSERFHCDLIAVERTDLAVRWAGETLPVLALDGLLEMRDYPAHFAPHAGAWPLAQALSALEEVPNSPNLADCLRQAPGGEPLILWTERLNAPLLARMIGGWLAGRVCVVAPPGLREQERARIRQPEKQRVSYLP